MILDDHGGATDLFDDAVAHGNCRIVHDPTILAQSHDGSISQKMGVLCGI